VSSSSAALGIPAALEELTHDPVPRVQPDERISGGAYTLREQAKEPFAAFARGRLGVRELERFAPGLSASRSGQIVHDALRRLLASCPSSAGLAGWSGAERQARILAAVAAAVEPHERHADAVLHGLLALERARVATLLERFLAAEAERQPFAIERVEAELRYLAHGVTLSLRADRLDRLGGDGGLLVLDYKTGEEEPLLDRDGEPADLQLVVYAAALTEAVAGIATVHLAGSRIRYRGIGAGVEWQALERAAWVERLERWKRKVDELAREFADGDVRVNVARPFDEARPLNLLSRVEELRRE
jgi:RecB family exonuclease